MQDCSLYLGKANLLQKISKRGPQSSEIFGQLVCGLYFAILKSLGKNFNEFIIWENLH